MLSASFYYYYDDRLNCQRALDKAVSRAGVNPQTEKIIRVRFGCDTAAAEPRVVIDGIGYHKCLCQYKHPLFYSYLELADRLDKGMLPDKGPYLDQPAQLLEALQLLAKLRAEAQAAEQEKQRKQAEKHGRK